ncbi:MAG TPA: hypothetical protein VK177_07185, partial [Flavobacteriales bacterium]|nr:hypothetical protein [Flavobacteriales bacterium]
LGAWILKLLIDQYKKTGIKFPSFSKTTVLNFICVLALPLIVFYINQKSAATGYSNQFEGTSVIETIKTNFSIQLGVINNLFIPDLPSYGYYNYTWVIFPLLILSGLIYHLFKKGYFLVFVFICYESLVLIFPYQYGTFRFLIPVLPILFLFVAHVVELFILNFKNRVVKIGSAALIYVALFAVNSIACAEKIKTLVVAGPEHYAAQEMFNFVKTKTPATAHLLFTKPKAMGYFGQRKCVTNKPTNTNKEIARLLLKYHVDHIVQGLENPALDHYIQQESAELDLVFSNKEFRVFKIKVK